MTHLESRDNGRILRFDSEIFKLLEGKTIQSVNYVDNDVYETLTVETTDGLNLVVESSVLGDDCSMLEVRMENSK